MDMSSLYFAAYALIATIVGIVAAQAQYTRKQREGKPINYTVLKVIFGSALAMWTGAALAAVYYTESHMALTVAGVLVGVILSLFFGWQINKVISKIQADERALEELATNDALTGLWIRRVFHKTLREQIAVTQQTGEPLSILLLKIDNLKEVNAQFGYEMGDRVLMKLAKIVKRSVRPDDMVCRFGSREIAIVFPNLDAVKAGKFTRAFQAEIASTNFNADEGEEVHVSVTAGIVGYKGGGQTEGAFLDAAENAVRIATKSGPNSLCVD